MPEFTFEVEKETFQRVQQIGKKIRGLNHRAFSEIISKMYTDVVKLTPRGVSGNARESISAIVSGNEIDGLHGKVFSDIMRVDVLEFGRTPGATGPPVGAVDDWVDFKGLRSREKPEDRPWNLYYIISRAIKWSPGRGRFMFQSVFNKYIGSRASTIKSIYDAEFRKGLGL